ncbi:MAG TPA: 7TM-DISM domain-containing protein, partial [Cytophagaceae bacterium]
MILKIIYKYCLTLNLLLMSIIAGAQNYTIRDVRILKEKSPKESPAEILKGSSRNFLPFVSNQKQSGEQEYWVKFTYSNRDLQNTYYLSYPNIIFKKIELYYFLKDSLYHYQSGFSIPFDKKNLYSPRTNLKLPSSQDSVVCLLYINSIPDYSFFFHITDGQSEFKNEITTARLEYFILGLGTLSVIFSLVFFFFLKERLYLYYALYSFTLILSRLTFNGYVYEYLLHFYKIDNLRFVYSLYT